MAQKNHGTGPDDPIRRSMEHDREQQSKSIMNEPQQSAGESGRDRNKNQSQHTDSRDAEVDEDVREVNISGPTQTK